MLACTLLAACANPPASGGHAGFERGTVLQRVDRALSLAEPGAALRLSALVNPLVTGETLQVHLHAQQDGYVYLYQVTTDGRSLGLIFPNAYDSANYLRSGQTLLPRGNWQLKAVGPAGTGYLLAVMTPKPLNLLALLGDARQGQIQLPPPYHAWLTALREVSAP